MLSMRELMGRARVLEDICEARLEMDHQFTWWVWQGDHRLHEASKEEVEHWEDVLYLPTDQFLAQVEIAKERRTAEERRGGFAFLQGGRAWERSLREVRSNEEPDGAPSPA